MLKISRQMCDAPTMRSLVLRSRFFHPANKNTWNLIRSGNRFKSPLFSPSVNSLGISDELKQKLQDVMVDRHKLTLGKTLGEGLWPWLSLLLFISLFSPTHPIKSFRLVPESPCLSVLSLTFTLLHVKVSVAASKRCFFLLHQESSARWWRGS